MTPKVKVEGEQHIPDEALELLARTMLPRIEEYYASEEGQRAFVKWKAEKEARKHAGKEER